MKKLSFLPLIAALLLLAPALCAGQKIQKTDGLYQVSGTIAVPDSAKSHLCLKALKWLGSGTDYGSYLLQGSDIDAFTLVCKGGWGMSLFMASGEVEHRLVLKARDGAMDYTFSNFVFVSPNSGRTRFDGPMVGKKGAIAKTEKEVALTVAQLSLWLRRKTP